MSYRRVIIDIIGITLLAFVVISIVHIFVAQPFVVSGNSMEPSFKAGDYLVIDELSYYLHPPRRGDLVIFRYPPDPSVFFIKRLIGMPGDVLTVGSDGTVTVIPQFSSNIERLSEPYMLTTAAPQATTTITLDKDEYFVLGDNRDVSFDSRVWGPVPGRYIIGRAIARLFPLSKVGLFPGAFIPEETAIASSTIHSTAEM